MTDDEKVILMECLKRQDEIAARPNPPKGRRWERLELDELREYGPRFSVPDWFGDEDGFIPERYRSRFLRTVWKLAEAGLVRATRTGARLSHIRLTDAGRAALTGATTD
jgi:hypothetical protein